MARVQPGPDRAVWIETKEAIRIHLANLNGTPIPILWLPPSTQRAAMTFHAEANPFRRQGCLKIVLKFMAASRAKHEYSPGLVIHDLLMIMATQPAEPEERLPSIHALIL